MLFLCFSDLHPKLSSLCSEACHLGPYLGPPLAERNHARVPNAMILQWLILPMILSLPHFNVNSPNRSPMNNGKVHTILSCHCLASPSSLEPCVCLPSLSATSGPLGPAFASLSCPHHQTRLLHLQQRRGVMLVRQQRRQWLILLLLQRWWGKWRLWNGGRGGSASFGDDEVKRVMPARRGRQWIHLLLLQRRRGGVGDVCKMGAAVHPSPSSPVVAAKVCWAQVVLGGIKVPNAKLFLALFLIKGGYELKCEQYKLFQTGPRPWGRQSSQYLCRLPSHECLWGACCLVVCIFILLTMNT